MGVRRFELEVRAPFRLDLTAWTLRRRPHNGLDRFDDGVYRRVFQVGGRVLEAAVRQIGGAEAPCLAVELESEGRAPTSRMESQVGGALRRLLGLDVDLTGFYELAGRDPHLGELAARFEGVRPPRFATVFEGLVNAVACQQLSLVVGIHLLNRLAAGYGPTLAEGGPAGFPEPRRLAEVDPEDLRPLGYSGAKARTVIGLARQIEDGTLDLDSLEEADDQTAQRVLIGIRGIGRWSAEYVLLRGLGRLQVLPGDDVGAQNNIKRRFGLDLAPGYKEMAALAEQWRPYGGLVYFHLLLDGLADGGHVEPNATTGPCFSRPN